MPWHLFLWFLSLVNFELSLVKSGATDFKMLTFRDLNNYETNKK
jgi:hypothetical protein